MKPALSRLRLPAWARKILKGYLIVLTSVTVPSGIYLADAWNTISGLRQMGHYQGQIQAEILQSNRDAALIEQCLPTVDPSAAVCMTQLAPKVHSPQGEVLLASQLKKTGDDATKPLQVELLRRAGAHLHAQMNTPWASLYRQTYADCQRMVFPCPAKLDPPQDNRILLQKINKAIAESE